MVIGKLPPTWRTWIALLATALHARVAHRLEPLLRGAVFARGRRTVSSWLRAGGVGRAYEAYYYFVGSLGRRVVAVAAQVLRLLLDRRGSGDRLLFALDDTPTKRYGPEIEGAGVHHNPTPGPADQKFLYGHVWVTVAWVIRHPWWGVIGLPLQALLYVRKKQIGLLRTLYGVMFRTKLEMAAELVEWLAIWLKFTGRVLWIVVDGAYASRPFMKRALVAGLVIVSRLRKNAALRSLPEPPRRGQAAKRGRKPKYGKEKISLAKRAAHRRGWQTADFVLYNKTVPKTFKTFLATYEPVGGVIRVVLVRETDGWVAFFCTEPTATVAEILEAVADRAAIEQDFHDIKEVHGTGQQQLRNYWANIAAYHLTLWLHTLVELWAWHRDRATLSDRSASPWDKPDRRPSHADRCKALRSCCLRTAIKAIGGLRSVPQKLRDFVRNLVGTIACC